MAGENTVSGTTGAEVLIAETLDVMHTETLHEATHEATMEDAIGRL
jgi:hypothetical protein